jgi:hypothetical protein
MGPKLLQIFHLTLLKKEAVFAMRQREEAVFAWDRGMMLSSQGSARGLAGLWVGCKTPPVIERTQRARRANKSKKRRSE